MVCFPVNSNLTPMDAFWIAILYSKSITEGESSPQHRRCGLIWLIVATQVFAYNANSLYTEGFPVTQTTSINQTDSVRVGIAYLSFIVLGMPGAMLGVAWSPAIRSTFNLSLDAVGALLVATMGSYFVASFISGRLVARVGFGTLLIASSFLTAVGLIGYVLSPSWPVMVAFGILVGGGGGVID